MGSIAWRWRRHGGRRWERFGRRVAEALGLPALLRFDDWTQALRLALGLDQPGGGRLVVLDEFPYLLHGAPELASAIQAVYDDSRNDPAAHLVLCGSAFTIMSELLSGARPLRGRSRLGLMVPPFDYRTVGRDARNLWHPLDVLRAGGFVRRSEDVLTRRRPIYAVADPIIRFGMLIVRPRQAMYEERQPASARRRPPPAGTDPGSAGAARSRRDAGPITAVFPDRFHRWAARCRPHPG